MTNSTHNLGAEQIGTIADRVEGTLQRQSQAIQSSLSALQGRYTKLAGKVEDITKAAAIHGLVSDKSAEKFLQRVSAVTDIANGIRGVDQILASAMRIKNTRQYATHAVTLEHEAIRAIADAQQTAQAGTLMFLQRRAERSAAPVAGDGQPAQVSERGLWGATQRFFGDDPSKVRKQRLRMLRLSPKTAPRDFTEIKEAHERRLQVEEQQLSAVVKRGENRSDELARQKFQLQDQLGTPEKQNALKSPQSKLGIAEKFAGMRAYVRELARTRVETFEKPGKKPREDAPLPDKYHVQPGGKHGSALMDAMTDAVMEKSAVTRAQASAIAFDQGQKDEERAREEQRKRLLGELHRTDKQLSISTLGKSAMDLFVGMLHADLKHQGRNVEQIKAAEGAHQSASGADFSNAVEKAGNGAVIDLREFSETINKQLTNMRSEITRSAQRINSGL